MPKGPGILRLSGLEPLDIGPDSLFVNVGERTNVTGSARFKDLILNDDYEAALEYIERAVSAGERDVEHFKTAQEFHPLHEDPRFRALLLRMVEAGRLGKKSGQGFYTY